MKMKTAKLPLSKKSRIWELDFLRGLCVLLMVWDHLMYNISDIFGKVWVDNNPNLMWLYDFSTNYWVGDLRTFFHPIIFSIFFVICGISCTLSRNNVSRGIKALLLAFAITLVTSMFDMIIKFGVLHMLAFSIIIYSIIDLACNHNKKLVSIICFVLGCVIIITNTTYQNLTIENMPEGLDFIANFLSNGNYESSDYFPMLPNCGYVLLGASIGGFWYSEKKSLCSKLDVYGWYKPIGFWGRIALPVYILHQPILIGILAFLSYTIITPGNWIFF